MALLETQSVRTSATAGTTQAPASAQPRSALTTALSKDIAPGEASSARSFLRHDRRDWDRGRHDRFPPHGPHRPGGPYYPRRTPPYYPAPLPPYYPYPSPMPGPLPGERPCSWLEQGLPGSRRDMLGQWWCRW